jgi:ketosteroid isomerase-like protein
VSAPKTLTPRALPVALAEALNAHDLDTFVSLFAPDYDSRQPAHPDRAFRGRDQVRINWSAVFSGVPDFHAELVATAVDGDTAWSEWRWRGTHRDGSRLDMAGVMICGVQAGRIQWARLYVEPIERGEGIDAAVQWASSPSAGGQLAPDAKQRRARVAVVRRRAGPAPTAVSTASAWSSSSAARRGRSAATASMASGRATDPRNAIPPRPGTTVSAAAGSSNSVRTAPPARSSTAATSARRARPVSQLRSGRIAVKFAAASGA